MTIRLIHRLVLRRILSLEDARELVDQALLDAEELFGTVPGGDDIREFLAAFLKDIDAPPSGE